MKEEKLQTVTLQAANAIRWVRYGKETTLDGKYFDIRGLYYPGNWLS